jgi:hypothetical protein
VTAAETARAASEAAQTWTRAELAAALEGTGHSLAELAAACAKNPTIAQDWQGGAKHLPVYALANERVPRSLRARLVGALVRRLETGATRIGLDAATARLLATSGELVSELATAWLDRELDDAERARIRIRVHALLEAAARWLREDGAA